MNTVLIGIDPGASGACAIRFVDGTALVHRVKDTPPVEALIDAVAEYGPANAVAYLERVGGFIAGKGLPGSSMFKMGKSAGYWEGALNALRIRTILVTPQVWQKGISGTTGKKGADRKRALRDEARRRFPAQKVTLDNCDALLILEYGVRMETGQK